MARNQRDITELYQWATLLIAPLLLMLITVIALVDRDAFVDSMREDHWVNWVTFGAWSLSTIGAAIKAAQHPTFSNRIRLFYFLIAVFCLFISLEEVNWGQRITQLESPETVQKRVGHSELSIHYIVTGLTGIPVDVLGGILLTLYGFVLPLLISAMPKLRRKLGVVIYCLPVPAVVPWFLIAGTIIATQVPGLDHEIGELLFAVSFMLFTICPVSVTKEYPGLDRNNAIAAVAGVVMLIIPIGTESSAQRKESQLKAIKSELSEVAQNGSEEDITNAASRALKLAPEIAKKSGLLHLALAKNSSKLLVSLLALGYDPDELNAEGKTPLIAAISSGNFEFAQQLLAYGADPSVTDKKGRAPIHFAIAAKDTPLLKAIVRRKPDLEDRDPDGLTPLMLAAISNNFVAVDLFLRAGANTTEIDPTGRKAVELAPPGSESATLLLAAFADKILEDASPGSAPAKIETSAALQFAESHSAVWDSAADGKLLFLSIGLINTSDRAARDLTVELIEDETVLAALSGPDEIPPGGKEEFSAATKIQVTDRSQLKFRATCGNCLPSKIERSGL